MRKTDAIRSDFAEPHTMTRVEFTFAIGEKEYRIERLPKQLVAKKRGTGMREQNASATVYAMEDGEWQVIATSAAAVRESVQSIIGFRKDQFLQVVLLPQGEFRKLLVASTGEREELLHTLFRTELYRRLQEALKEAYESSKQGIEENLTKQQIVLQSIPPHDEDTPILTIEHVRQLLASRVPQRDVLEKQRDEAVRIVADYDALRNRWALYNQVKQSLLDAQIALDKVKAKEPERCKLARQVQFLTALKPVYELYKQHKNKADNLHTLEKTLAEAQTSLVTAQVVEAQCCKAYEVLQAQSDAMQKNRVTLTYWEQQAESLIELESTQKELDSLIKKRAEYDVVQAEKAALLGRENVQNLQHEIQTLRDRISSNIKETDRIHTVKDRLSVLDTFKTVQSEWQTLSHAMDNKVERLSKLDNEVHSAKVQLERLEHLLQEGRAYELADLVKDNAPCPVCGSLEHPALAKKPELYPTKKEVDTARKLYQDLIETLAKEQGAKESLAQRIAEAEATLDKQQDDIASMIDGFSADTFDDTYTSLRADVIRLEALRTDTEVLQDTLRHKEEALVAAEKEVSDLEKAKDTVASEAHRLDVKIGTVQAKTDTLSVNLRIDDIDTWRIKLTNLKAELSTYDEDVTKARTRLESARQTVSGDKGRVDTFTSQVRQEAESLATVRKAYEQSLAAIDLVESEFEEQLADYEQCDTYREKLKILDDDYQKAQAVYESAQKKSDSTVKPEDMVSDEMYEAAVQSRDDIVGALATWDKESEQIEDALRKLEVLDAAMGEACDEVEFLGRLNDLANGGAQGFKNVTFERYVLGAILDEVVYAANLRLQRMSRSRYFLERSDYIGGGRGKQGA
nr:SMC family ATPase [Veillonella denticariosi]